MIGPDIQGDSEMPLNQGQFDIRIRSSCKAVLVQRKGLYHDAATSLIDSQATVLFASHAGIADGSYTSSWAPTLKMLAKQDVPFVVTGYNLVEVMSDKAHIERYGSEVIVEPIANPFRGLRPFPDPSLECGRFIYSNSHYFVAKGKSK